MMYYISLHAMERIHKFFAFKYVIFMNVSTGKNIWYSWIRAS